MKKEAAGDFSHLKNKKGELIAQPLPQPTLPNVSLDDEEDAGSMRSRGPAPGAYGGGKEYGLDYPPMDYPPMPAFNQQPYGLGNDAYHHYNPSMGTLPEDQQHYDDNDYGSTTHLTLGAAPIAYPDDQRHGGGNDIYAPRPMHGAHVQEQSQLYAYNSDPHAAYRGPSPVAHRGPSPVPPQGYEHELAYDDGAQYYQQQSQHQYQHQHQQQQDAYGYGYPPNDHQRGNYEGHEYDAGQAHAM